MDIHKNARLTPLGRERMVNMLAGRGLCRAYLNSRQRADELPFFMHRYNWQRPHAGIGAKPPISRLALTEDNLLRLHS